MGLCWSEPPPTKQAPVVSPLVRCKSCGIWNPQDYCQTCLQNNAMSYMKPSAPPFQQTQANYPYPPQQQQYTYAVPYPPLQSQQQMYSYYQTRPQYPPQQQPQMGTGTAIATGFVVGALMDDILDPM
jgi:hypothetical protein